MPRKFRIVTEGGNVDIDIEGDFDLPTTVKTIRGDGYAMGPTFYVPIERIVAMFIWDPAAPAPFTPRSKETLQ